MPSLQIPCLYITLHYIFIIYWSLIIPFFRLEAVPGATPSLPGFRYRASMCPIQGSILASSTIPWEKHLHQHSLQCWDRVSLWTSCCWLFSETSVDMILLLKQQHLFICFILLKLYCTFLLSSGDGRPRWAGTGAFWPSGWKQWWTEYIWRPGTYLISVFMAKQQRMSEEK